MELDFGSMFGIVVAVAALFFAIILNHDNISLFLNPSAFLLVIGGTIGATALSVGVEEIFLIPKLIGIVFSSRKLEHDFDAIIDLFKKLAKVKHRPEMVRVANTKDLFLRRGLNFIADGTHKPNVIREILSRDIETMRYRHETASNTFQVAAGYAPTMGIMGTVVGLISVLTQASTATAGNLGTVFASFGTAFVATFLGISTANLFWMPLYSKLVMKSEKEIIARQLMLEGLIILAEGSAVGSVDSIGIEDKMKSFLKTKMQEEGAASAIR